MIYVRALARTHTCTHKVKWLNWFRIEFPNYRLLQFVLFSNNILNVPVHLVIWNMFKISERNQYHIQEEIEFSFAHFYETRIHYNVIHVSIYISLIKDNTRSSSVYLHNQSCACIHLNTWWGGGGFDSPIGVVWLNSSAVHFGIIIIIII